MKNRSSLTSTVNDDEWEKYHCESEKVPIRRTHEPGYLTGWHRRIKFLGGEFNYFCTVFW